MKVTKSSERDKINKDYTLLSISFDNNYVIMVAFILHNGTIVGYPDQKHLIALKDRYPNIGLRRHPDHAYTVFDFNDEDKLQFMMDIQ